MKKAKTFIVCCAAFSFFSCTTYRVHLAVIPPSEYDVTINGKMLGKTPVNGDTTLHSPRVSIFSQPLLEVKKDSLYGKLRMNYNGEPADLKNVQTFKTKSDSEQFYDVTFVLDKKYLPSLKSVERHEAPAANQESITALRIRDSIADHIHDSIDIAYGRAINCDSSYSLGLSIAKTTYNPGGWAIGSFLAGLGGGLIGTAIVIPCAANSNPTPDTIPRFVKKDCYSDGYTKAAKKSRVVAAVSGSLSGWALWILIFMLAILPNM